MRVLLEGCQVAKDDATTTKPTEAGEVKAKQKLDLAKNYVQGGMTQKAREILEGVVKDYPGTQAADEAQQMIEAMEKGGKK
jgi:FimV-like protein